MLLWEQRDQPMYVSLEWNGKMSKDGDQRAESWKCSTVVSRHLASPQLGSDYDQTY